MDYGRALTRNGWLDFLGKAKNRMVTRLQNGILKAYSRLSGKGFLSKLIPNIVRPMVGGYIYSIKIEINDYCTLSCKMCYVNRSKHNLKMDTIRKLVDDVRGYGIRLEILGGEPLMHPDIIDIIDYAKSSGKVPFITLYTNGIMATPDMSRSLHDAGLDAIIVSLISHKEQVHDEFTGTPGSWRQTKDGIHNLKEAGVPVYTFTAIHKDNHHDIEGLYRFVKEDLGVHALFYQYIPQIKDDPLMIDNDEWYELKNWVLSKNPIHDDFVRTFYMLTGNACSGGNFVFTVKVDGSVQPCPFVSDISLGNIHDDSIWHIFKNRFRGTRLKEFKQLPEECLECSYKSICGGGCRAGNNALYGTYLRRDHRCLGPFKEKVDPQKITKRTPCFF